MNTEAGSDMRVKALIHGDNYIYNLENMKANLKPGTKIMAVIKTDAYGHGSVMAAEIIEPLPYIFGFAVATAEEGLELRRAGVKKPILILGYTFPESYGDIILNELRPAVFTFEMAKELSETALRLNKEVNIHIKVDTGMGRIGIYPDENGVSLAKDICSLPGIVPEGIFTHFAKADMTDKEPTFKQLKLYSSFVESLSEKGIVFKVRHCSNSAGIIRFPEANFDMVRAGITLYGLWPSDETERNIVSLKPVMEIKSHIAYIKEINEGWSVGYGGTFTAKEKVRVATIPVGYGDGYPRSLSNKGYVLIRGKRADIIGRVCMDQFMVDVTDIPEAVLHDEVTLIGTDGDEVITMEALGDLSGRFNYELACDINRRVKRVRV